MANNPQITVAVANRMLDTAIGDRANNGYIRIYTGTQPATADTAVGAQTLLAELRFGADAFPAASGGVLTANAITADTTANATGTAAWFRVLESDGTTVLYDGTVDTTGADLNMNSTAIQSGAEVRISSLTITHPLT